MSQNRLNVHLSPKSNSIILKLNETVAH